MYAFCCTVGTHVCILWLVLADSSNEKVALLWDENHWIAATAIDCQGIYKGHVFTRFISWLRGQWHIIMNRTSKCLYGDVESIRHKVCHQETKNGIFVWLYVHVYVVCGWLKCMNIITSIKIIIIVIIIFYRCYENWFSWKTSFFTPLLLHFTVTSKIVSLVFHLQNDIDN